jgi:hypothetical protein
VVGTDAGLLVDVVPHGTHASILCDPWSSKVIVRDARGTSITVGASDSGDCRLTAQLERPAIGR